MKEQILDILYCFHHYCDEFGNPVMDDIPEAASAISAMVEKERDEFAAGFAEWMGHNYVKLHGVGFTDMQAKLTLKTT